MKLTERQAALLQALKDGVDVHYAAYMGRFNPNAYYYRSDTRQRVTAQAKALIKRGLAKRSDDWRSQRLVLADAPKNEA
jgi:hypothetical protein